MKKMTRQQLEERKARLTEAARSEVAKREVMHFRLDAATIQGLYEIAEEQQRPVGAMVREWVSERLDRERGVKTTPTITERLSELEHRISSLEKLRRRA